MDDLIGVTEAAGRLGVSKEWIQKLCQQGRIEGARKVGRQWVIPVGAKIASAEPRPLRTLEIPGSKHAGAGPRAGKRGKR